MLTNYEQYIKVEGAKLDLFAKPAWFAQVTSDLERHEGFREFAYPDSLSALHIKYKSQKWGFRPASDILQEIGVSYADAVKLGAPWTVGIGFTKGVTPMHRMERTVAKRRLSIEILEHAVELDFILPEWKTYPVVVQGVLVNLMYNLGRTSLSKFGTTLNFIKNKQFKSAGTNLRKSRWFKQVGGRAVELTNRLITGTIEASNKV